MILLRTKNLSIITLALVLLPCIKLYSQSFSDREQAKIKSTENLDLSSGNKEIENTFRITIPEKNCKKLSKTQNLEKNYISDCIMTYNHDTVIVNELNLRGKSSMEYKRKSFSVKLDKKIPFTKKGDTIKLKKFNLISLSMDRNYYRNKVAFDLMSELGIFNLFYNYAEVIVNGESQGVYLLVQKPKNYAFKKEKSTFMLRRDYRNVVKKSYCKGKDSVLQAKCEKAFNSIYNEVTKKSGQEFYDNLLEVLDVDQYLTWMAFNYLIGNRDYTDEVFFYNKAQGDSIRFGIIPWDYDDIFYEYPREGSVVQHINFGGRLAFSSEDDLDFKLITDDYTYAKYLEILINVVNQYTLSLIKETFESTYQDLHPFYCNKETISMSKIDKYGKTDLKALESDMQLVYQGLVQKREKTVETLLQLIQN